MDSLRRVNFKRKSWVSFKCKSTSYGFIRGRSVKKAALKARKIRNKHPWVYKTDITKFFDTIDRDALKAVIKKEIPQRSLHPILYAAVDCEIDETIISRQLKIKKAGILPGKGVRQGMPISPFFANLILRNFDQAVINNGLRMIRYADDFIIMGDSETECFEIHEFCKNELQNIELSVPEINTGSKTTIYPPDEIAEFLGVGIVPSGKHYSVNILREQTDKVRNKILGLADYNYLLENNITIGKLGQRLEGIISGYLDAYHYCDNINQFNSFLITTRNKALIKIFREGFGIDVNKLTTDQRLFLGLVDC